ncbi:MAG: hypothetical protein R3C44_18195 [Chloroflexota bacterium]
MLWRFLTPSAESDYTYPPELKQGCLMRAALPLRMSEKGRALILPYSLGPVSN